MQWHYYVVVILLVLIQPLAHAEWKGVKETDGITVYTKKIAGMKLHEIKAVGLIDASSDDIYKVITDLDHYADFMPHTKISKLLGKKKTGFIFYSLIDAPLVKRRDYTVLITPIFDVDGVKGKIKISWEAANDLGPGPKKDVIRLEKNSGHWLLEPISENKTNVTYYLFTDPGGEIPSWMVNTANKKAVPDIIKSVRKRVKQLQNRS